MQTYQKNYCSVCRHKNSYDEETWMRCMACMQGIRDGFNQIVDIPKNDNNS